MTRNAYISSYIRTRGFTLMEVLVALVIISIGLIGIAAMQASAIASTHSSQSESLVSIEARSLADAMQANPNYWRGGNFPTEAFSVSAPASGSSLGTVTDATLESQTTNCATTACSISQLAGYDVRTWGAQLNSVVPGATAGIFCQAAKPTTCNITVSWSQKATAAVNSGTQSTATPTAMSYTLTNQF